MQVIETKPKTNNMSKDTWIRAYKQFNEIANPQKTELKDFLEAPFQVAFSEEEIHEQKVYDQYISVLQLKLDGLEKEPTPIEKTMTPVQLYESGSPLWALGYDADTIWKIILYAKYFANQNEDRFAETMFEFVDEKLMTDGALYATDMVSIHQQMIHARMS